MDFVKSNKSMWNFVSRFKMYAWTQWISYREVPYQKTRYIGLIEPRKSMCQLCMWNEVQFKFMCLVF